MRHKTQNIAFFIGDTGNIVYAAIRVGSLVYVSIFIAVAKKHLPWLSSSSIVSFGAK
jgi:hypothetical protein